MTDMQQGVDALPSDGVDQILEGWARIRPELDVSALDVLGRLHRSFLLYKSKVHSLFHELGINEAGFDVLASLRRAAPDFTRTAGELAQMTLVTTGGMTSRVKRLEEAGLVRRRRDDRDARVVYVTLTPAGMEVIDRVADAHFQNAQAMLHGLDTAQRGELAALLRELEQSISTSSPMPAKAD